MTDITDFFTEGFDIVFIKLFLAIPKKEQTNSQP